MSLKRKRLDEILSTSIEDIENMFSWKIGAREAECPMPATASVNKSPAKKIKKSTSDVRSCFSAQSTNLSSNTQPTNSLHLLNYLSKPQVAHPQANIVLKSSIPPPSFNQSVIDSLDDNMDDDWLSSIPPIDMIDSLIINKSTWEPLVPTTYPTILHVYDSRLYNIHPPLSTVRSIFLIEK